MVKDLVPVATALESSIFQEPPIIITKPWSLINATLIFFFCVKHYPHQLLKGNFTNQKYMENDYTYWSKSSIYLLALRNADISICLTTNKYTKLLGYIMLRETFTAKKIYSSLINFRPRNLVCWRNDIENGWWQKTLHAFFDGSLFKMVLGYSVENSSSPKRLRTYWECLFKTQTMNHHFCDRCWSGKCKYSAEFLTSTNHDIKHSCSRNPFSNSKIEAFNKNYQARFCCLEI
jgi:hypothetical protein